jgi:hypothetical protein
MRQAVTAETLVTAATAVILIPYLIQEVTGILIWAPAAVAAEAPAAAVPESVPTAVMAAAAAKVETVSMRIDIMAAETWAIPLVTRVLEVLTAEALLQVVPYIELAPLQ